MLLTNEEKLWNYIEGLKLKLHAAILDKKGEAIASRGELFKHHSAEAEVLTKFGIDAGLLDKDDLLLNVSPEKKVWKDKK